MPLNKVTEPNHLTLSLSLYIYIRLLPREYFLVLNLTTFFCYSVVDLCMVYVFVLFVCVCYILSMRCYIH